MTYAAARHAAAVARLNFDWHRKTTGFRVGLYTGMTLAAGSICLSAAVFLALAALAT